MNDGGDQTSGGGGETQVVDEDVHVQAPGASAEAEPSAADRGVWRVEIGEMGDAVKDDIERAIGIQLDLDISPDRRAVFAGGEWIDPWFNFSDLLVVPAHGDGGGFTARVVIEIEGDAQARTNTFLSPRTVWQVGGEAEAPAVCWRGGATADAGFEVG